MKKLTTLLLAGVGALLLAQSAHAQTVFNQGDIQLGFYDNNATSDYEVDLGPLSTFTNVTSTITVANLSSDLGTTFNSVSPTSTWTTDVNLNWGAAGYSGTTGSDSVAAKILFLTEAVSATAPADLSSGSNGTIGGHINTITSAFNGKTIGQSTTASTPDAPATFDALVQSNGATSAWVDAQGGATQANGTLSGGNSFASGFNINSTFAAGTAGAGLALYEMTPGTNTTPTLLGEFEISNSGVVTFGPEVAVIPEPSTYALLALSLGMLLWVVKRRNSAFRA